MRRPFLQLIGVCVVVLAVILLLKFTVTNQASSPAASADTPATKSSGLKTPWGEPDLQGIWTDEYQTPLQRPAKYAGKEFFTDEERTALDEKRAAVELRPRAERGTERDVAGADNQDFMSIKSTCRSMSERCMAAVLPDFTGFRRIVQSPGSVAIFYDVGQGQGWQRIVPVAGSPHLPSPIPQRFGDSRGRWEGETLVVDVTNFSPKS